MDAASRAPGGCAVNVPWIARSPLQLSQSTCASADLKRDIWFRDLEAAYCRARSAAGKMPERNDDLVSSHRTLPLRCENVEPGNLHQVHAVRRQSTSHGMPKPNESLHLPRSEPTRREHMKAPIEVLARAVNVQSNASDDATAVNTATVSFAAGDWVRRGHGRRESPSTHQLQSESASTRRRSSPAVGDQPGLRRLHVINDGAGGASLWIRDVTLGPASKFELAKSLVENLRHWGVRVSAVAVNGEELFNAMLSPSRASRTSYKNE